MIAPLVKLLEVAMHAGETDAGWAALEPVKLAVETSSKWLGRTKNKKEIETRERTRRASVKWRRVKGTSSTLGSLGGSTGAPFFGVGSGSGPWELLGM
jgi:hypothetical protein